MAYPVDTTPSIGATPNPAYTGVFIPEIWAGKLIEKFYDATVLAAIANTDYEGEISNYGDKVNIRQKPTITINNYQADGDLTYERPSAAVAELLIDAGKYWATVLDDVMEVQADLNMLSMWADDASEQMKIAIDTDVLQTNMLDAAAAENKGATAGRLSGDIDLGNDTTGRTFDATTAVDVIVDVGLTLDEQNIPETGRWLVLNAKAASLIKKSELRDASLTGDGVSMLRNGRLGMIDRFTLYSSNLLPVPAGTATTTIYAGHSTGLTFASQLTKMETLRAESTFGTLMRGLQVWGFQVTDPTALVEAKIVA